MIEIQGLTKRYGSVTAIDALTVTIRPGAVTGLLGPNGAGKTTLLRVALGLAAPTAGQVMIHGRRYRDITRPLQEVGMLLGADAVEGGRRALDHLGWIARSQRIDAARVREVLDMVGLEDAARRAIATFSLGMRQRLGLAVALLGDPRTLILDEPVNGLDPEGIRWLRDLLRTLAADGRTVLLSSHLMAEMAITADQLVVIADGRLLADATVDELSHRHGSLEDAYLELVAGAANTGSTHA